MVKMKNVSMKQNQGFKVLPMSISMYSTTKYTTKDA